MSTAFHDTDDVGSGAIPPHVPTSAALARLREAAPSGNISMAWLIGHLEKRSFGVLMLIVAFLGLAPGIAMLAAILLPFLAIQMILGRDVPTLPRFLAARSIPSRHFARWATWAIPLLTRMEVFIRPRWHTPFQTTKRLVGLLALLLAITLLAPFPFNIIPTLSIMLISFAYLEEDGILLCISLVVALLSFAITTATILATLEATGIVERLWMRV